jgi:hypothetical protein
MVVNADHKAGIRSRYIVGYGYNSAKPDYVVFLKNGVTLYTVKIAGGLDFGA